MPELPEVETVARALAPVWEGHRFTHILRHPTRLRRPVPEDFAARLTGRTVETVGRRGKYLVIRGDGGLVLLIHLGMSGRILFFPPGEAPPLSPHDHAVFTMNSGIGVVFRDPRRFGMLDLCRVEDLPQHPLLASLGPEPLGQAFTPAVLGAALCGKRTAVKVALLDQRVIAGLGNIYGSESLFRAGISPLRLAGDLSAAEVARLVPAIQSVLAEAITAGGSTLKDYIRPTGEQGYFQHHFAVYGRAKERCPGCNCTGNGIIRIVQGGRSTFYCANKQR